MPKRVQEMTALQVRRLNSPGFHAVGGVPGLLLQVTPGEGRSWVLRTMVGGKRRSMGLGSYPGVSLSKAREAAASAREQIQAGIDPIAARKAAKGAILAAQARELTFAEAAERCHASKSAEFRNAKHRQQWINTLKRYAYPVIGNAPVSSIDLPLVLKVLEPIWKDKTETATRLRQRIESVLTWATVSGYRSGDNPARWQGNLAEVLAHPAKLKKEKKQHHPALPWQRIPEFMADLRARDGMGARALEFAILTACRSGEVRGAAWDEIDFSAGTWTIPASRMKAGNPHTVPLSHDALTLLEKLPRMAGQPLIFPATRGGQLSDMTLSSCTRRMHQSLKDAGGEGYTDPNADHRPVVPHGFRSSFKDWCRNQAAFPDEVSELALAHVNNDATRAAYARDKLLPQRTKLLAAWAQYCRQKPGAADVVSMQGKRGAQ